jgi:hypothetical protein
MAMTNEERLYDLMDRISNAEKGKFAALLLNDSNVSLEVWEAFISELSDTARSEWFGRFADLEVPIADDEDDEDDRSVPGGSA